MATRNDVTKDLIKSRTINKAYSNGYDLWMENIRKEKELAAKQQLQDKKKEDATKVD